MISYSLFKNIQNFLKKLDDVGFEVYFDSKEVGILNLRIYSSFCGMDKLKDLVEDFLINHSENICFCVIRGNYVLIKYHFGGVE